MVFRFREVLIRQRTQLINALRGHLSQFGQVVPQGTSNVPKLIRIVVDPTCGLPSEAMATLPALIISLRHLEAEIAKLDAQIARRAKEDDQTKRLTTIPGTGPLTATAFVALVPAAETFRKGRGSAAWLASCHDNTQRAASSGSGHNKDG